MKTTFIKTLLIVLFITSFLAGGFFVFISRVSAEEGGEFQIDSTDFIEALPEIVDEQSISGETASSSGENPIWKINDDGSATTAQDVSMGLIYRYPKNEDVFIKFTLLPEISGTITIREIKLSREEQEMLGALSDTAYDITSTMENGAFTYDLTLPLPQNANNLDVKVKYAETKGELFKDIGAEYPDEQTQNNITIKDLNHFTIFVVTTDVPPLTGPACIDAGADGTDLCFNSIQAAIDAANPGDTINIAAGTYNEGNPTNKKWAILIDKQLTLLGAQAGVDARNRSGAETIIDANSYYGVGIYINGGGDGTVIDGIEVKNSYYFDERGAGIGLEDGADYVTIRNTYVHNNNNQGIQSFLRNSGHPINNNILIEKCRLEDNGDSGLKIYGSSHVTMQDNLFRNNGDYGVLAWNYRTLAGYVLDDVQILRNQFFNNGDNIKLDGDTKGITNAVVASNETSFGTNGIYLRKIITSAQVYDNTVASSSVAGINIKGKVTSAGVTGNTITGNVYGVSVADDAGPVTGALINANNIVGNTGYGVRNEAAATVDATKNYWGDATGPYHLTTNPLGTENAVSNNVDYSPWWGANYVGDLHTSSWIWYTNDSIQDAIDAASDGDTINVAAGTYVQTENLVVNKPVTIIGASGSRPTIQIGTGVVSVVIAADNVVLDNLRFYKPDTSSDTAVIIGTRIWGEPVTTIPYGGLTIKNSLIEGGRRGIFVEEKGPVLIENNEWLNQYRDSIFVANLRGGTMDIIGNTFTNGGKKAIIFEEHSNDRLSGTIRILNNTVNGGNSRGNFIVYNHWADPSLKVDMTIRTNIINQITSSAIAIYYPVDYDKFSNILIEGNDIYDAGGGIILDYADGGPDITLSNGQIVVENNVLCRFASSDLTFAIPIYDSGIDSDNKAIGVKGSGPTDTNGFGTISGSYGTAAVTAVNYGCDGRIVDTTAPTVDAGLNIASSSDITIDGSSAEDASGIKSYLWEKVSGPGDVTFSDNTILNPLVSVAIAGAYKLKLTVTDNADNSASDEMIYTKLSNNQIIASSDTNVTAEQNEIVINCSNNSTAASISIPSSVNDAKVNVNSLINDSGSSVTAILPQISISVITSISNNPVMVSIPAETTITAPTGWDGTINAPTIKDNSSVSVPVDSNQTADVSSVIEIGYGDVKLVFDKAVRILLPGQAGKYVGYSRSGTFTSIDSVCSEDSQSAGDALLPEGDCKIDSGSDLVVWTKHFTEFITYTLTSIVPQNPPSGGGGGGNPGSVELTISNEANTNVIETGVTITWTTNYKSTSQIIYAAEGENHTLNLNDFRGNPPKYGYARTTAEYDEVPKVINHSITIIDLTPGTTYYYRTVSHGSLAVGEERTFTTPGEQQPIIPLTETGGNEITEGNIAMGEETTPTPEIAPEITLQSSNFFLAFVDKWDFVMRKLWQYGIQKIKPSQKIAFQPAMFVASVHRQNLLVTLKVVEFILNPLWAMKNK